MNALRTLRRFAAWLALAGVVAGALWPLLAHARPASAAFPTVLCTSTGFKVLDGAPAFPAPATHPALEHCALCLGPLAFALAHSPRPFLAHAEPRIAQVPAVAPGPSYPEPFHRHPPSRAPPARIA